MRRRSRDLSRFVSNISRRDEARRRQPALQNERPELFTALEEQAGLKLVGKRAPVDVLVIDTVERPSPD